MQVLTKLFFTFFCKCLIFRDINFKSFLYLLWLHARAGVCAGVCGCVNSLVLVGG